MQSNISSPNGTQTTYTYDPASQVTAISHQLSAISSQLNKAEYVYNNVGNRTSLTDRRGVQNFGYDNLDRLTSADHPLLATPQSFAYDAVGNRTTNGAVVNAGNQLTADANLTYQYDDNGNLTRKTLTATGNYTQFTYDAENRLVKVEEFATGNPTAIATSTYRYDGLGRRIEKVANGQTRRYIYDAEDILLEYDGSNVLQARYTHGPGIDEPLAMQRGGTTYFYHADGLGTVTDLTDSNGATAQSYAYDAYGNIVQQTGTVENPYTYTGRELDSETGLYYYRARYYDPRTGRFLQKDPISFAAGDMNLYTYVKNNPSNFIDPEGLKVVFAGTPDQQLRLKLAYDKLNATSSTAQSISKRLEDHPETITIRATTGGNWYDPSINMLGFNPCLTTIGDGSEIWQHRPPEIGLGHELIHAIHDVTSTLGRTRIEEENKTIGVGPYSAAKDTENSIRRDYGLPLRPRY